MGHLAEIKLDYDAALEQVDRELEVDVQCDLADYYQFIQDFKDFDPTFYPEDWPDVEGIQQDFMDDLHRGRRISEVLGGLAYSA